nr:MAG TPA: hypothetical protein [Caudoviricetes sp.]
MTHDLIDCHTKSFFIVNTHIIFTPFSLKSYFIIKIFINYLIILVQIKKRNELVTLTPQKNY